MAAFTAQDNMHDTAPAAAQDKLALHDRAESLLNNCPSIELFDQVKKFIEPAVGCGVCGRSM